MFLSAMPPNTPTDTLREKRERTDPTILGVWLWNAFNISYVNTFIIRLIRRNMKKSWGQWTHLPIHIRVYHIAMTHTHTNMYMHAHTHIHTKLWWRSQTDSFQLRQNKNFQNGMSTKWETTVPGNTPIKLNHTHPPI